MTNGWRTLTLSLGLWIGSFAFAQEKVYKVGVEDLEYYPHYHFAKDKNRGFGPAILDAFAKAKGIKFEYVPLSINRLFDEFANKQSVDFKFPDNELWKKEQREGKKILYSESVVGFVDGIMVLPAVKGKGLPALKTLGTVTGFSPYQYLDDIKNGKIKLQENPNFAGLIRQGLGGRVDGIYIDVAIAAHILKNELGKSGELVFDSSLPHSSSNYHLATIKHADVMKSFNEYLASHKAEIEELKKKYYSVGP